MTAERAMTRKPVLTLYRQRPPEVGVPSENPMLNEPGLVITDFVDRVGDPDSIVVADGTPHRSETLVADALRALSYAVTDGRALPDPVAVTHPAHWGPEAVSAVRVALGRVSEWSDGRLALVSDSVAALIALQANPGIPSRGIIAVCDFGGTGTTLSLLDADGYQAVAPAVRHAEFSGDRIDQALLTYVVTELSSTGSFDTSATSAIGSLARLRGVCRHAKEELSSTIETTLTADVPGYRGDVRVGRDELEDAIREPLDGFMTVVHETLQRNGIRAEDLVAIASVGGGASIPTVTMTLSEQLGAPIITAPRPHLTAAIGAALRAARGPADSPTALAPTAAGAVADATTMSDIPVEPRPAPALAWSEADDDSGIMPIRPGEYPEPSSGAGLTAPRPPASLDGDSSPAATGAVADAWYRRPVVVALGTALVVLAIAAAVMITLHHTSGSAPTTPAPGVSTAPAPSSATNTQAPATNPPSSTESDTGTPSSTTSEAPTTTTTTTQAPTTTTSAPPTTTEAPTSTQDRKRPGFPRFPGGPRGFPEPQPGFR
ncbi:Hsp70 family protein [Mycobacterium sp.]|uniref:Hsp70 family protein n=1 Tax=Mycobacterium sp. TaxID=1785 RepID=UPI002D1FA437|nr:Hsp70 family protein [Mycobacterium sp.]